MRKIININENWAFTKEIEKFPQKIEENYEKINLPHTWNALDGQDGGNDYYRGTCYYIKNLNKSEFDYADKYYLEICGANSSADVYIDGKKLAHHDGGYSTWRVDITNSISEKSLLVIAVDNAPNDFVYPQMADFTFYGGLYRDVNLIAVSSSHFDLEYYGGSGIKITPTIIEQNADIEIEVFLTNYLATQSIRYIIYDAQNNIIGEQISSDFKCNFIINNVNKWHGKKNPYLYLGSVELLEDGKVIDNISEKFGCRTFEIDNDKGFILNGEEYPLRGVSRHQDRLGIGNALLKEHHDEDMQLILEMGASTIRLAHYQHDQYFYDLCDKYGLVVWAEIPYISKNMHSARANTISQMTELIVQNYNHPSIAFWGLSNEISMSGSDFDLIENHHILNDMAHKMDKNRLTTIAAVSMAKIDDPYIHISDVVAYNHYFGWYGGDVSMNGPWFDKFHKRYPSTPIGVSEYGCEALNWHTSNPTQGDYTEEYQAYYHEELIKQLFSRKYLWATYVWNMFDFGADARAEGGENGQNHKGLVTMDRKYKKDSFYAYKAWLSDEPFVHICSKRYVDRVENKTKITVYSNLLEVELFVNDKSVGKQRSDEHFFYFLVENKGESKILAKAGDCVDQSTIRKVEEENQDYILKEKGTVINWFDVEIKEGRFSLNDKIGDILKTLRGKVWFVRLGLKLKREISKNSEKNSKGMDVKLSPEMLEMMKGFSVLRLANMMGMMNVSFSKEQLLKMNEQLNKIKKPKNN